MAKVCCVDGCVISKNEVTFFKFPNSRAQRRKWLDAIPSTSARVTLDTLVCSQHFLPEQYELVRGKRRLKAKVVPSVFDMIPNSPQKDKSEESCDNESDRVAAEPKVTTDKSVDTEQEETSDQRLQTTDDVQEEYSTEEDKKETEKQIETERKMDTDENGDNNSNIRVALRSQPDNISISDCESNKDIEEILTGYQIKQTRPVHKQACTQTDTATDASRVADSGETQVGNGETEVGRNGETEVGRNREVDNVIDLDNLADPVFIEVEVGKGGTVQEASNQDCMMLLESVQCEVDPTSLMYLDPDPDPGPDDPGNDSDVIDLGEKKDEPVSLLTSSDEDEVIIEEPKYDMIEVSDETDEDDVPLVQFLGLPKQKPGKKHSEGDTLTKILWGKLYEYYCMECKFKSISKGEYKRHQLQHQKGIHVCEICSYTTASKQQFDRHNKKHKDERRFKCHLCNYKARRNMSLLYHMKTHEHVKIVTKKGVFKCEKCGFLTCAKSDLLKHLRACARPGKKYACDKCTYETDRRTDMKRHVARRHGDDEEYVPKS